MIASRSSGRLLVVLGLLAIGLVAPATVARAHAQLVESSPNHGAVVDDAPATIELRFNETVLAIPGAVVLRSGDSEIPGRTRVEGTTLTFTPTGPVPDGTAVLDWRSTSEDGHVIGGKLVFHVREITQVLPDEPVETTWSVGAALANAVGYLGLVLGGGLALFSVLVHDRGPEARDLRRLTVVLMVTGVVGALASVTLKGVHAAGRVDLAALPPGTLPMVATLLPGVALVAVARRRDPIVIGVAAALLSLVFVGHTRTFGPVWLVAGSDFIHLLAGSVWAGGLVGLALVVRRRREGGSPAASVMQQFSFVAGWSLLGVSVTGLVMAWRIHGTWSSLIGTGHGRLILAKLGIVAAVGVVAAFNRYRVLPLTMATQAARRLASTTVIEATGLVLLLVLTGFLVEQAPTASSAGGPVVVTGPVQGAIGDLLLSVGLEPGGVGVNEATVVIRTADGSEASLQSPPRLVVTDEAGGRTTFETDRVGVGFGATVEIPRSGEWAIEVRARVDTFTEAVQSFRYHDGVLVPESGIAVTGAVMPEPPGGSTNAVVYMTVVAAADELIVGANSPACGEATIHESIVNPDGTATMEHRHHIELSAGEPVTMSSGGLHVMCEQVTGGLRVGDTIQFTVVTANGGEARFVVDIVDFSDILE